MKSRMIHEHRAVQVTLDISQEDQTASFLFLQDDGDARQMVLPLFELARLHQHIAARLVEEPELFSPLTRGKATK